MAVVLPGWFDDSKRDTERHRVAALGGCVGTVEQWKVQDAAWKDEVLARFGLTDYHAKEFATLKGQYAQFENNPDRTLELSNAILGTFKKSQVRPFAAMTRLADLRRFNSERGRCVSYYALNIYTCMSYIRRCFKLGGDKYAQMHLDRSGDDGGTHRAVHLAGLYASTHPESPGPIENILVTPMPKEALGRHTPALQAADFVASEVRRFVEQWCEFYEARPDGESTQDLRNALTKWSEETKRRSPFERGSLRGLMSGRPWATIHTWHFNSLCTYDDLRGGLWVPKEWDADSTTIQAD